MLHYHKIKKRWFTFGASEDLKWKHMRNVIVVTVFNIINKSVKFTFNNSFMTFNNFMDTFCYQSPFNLKENYFTPAHELGKDT